MVIPKQIALTAVFYFGQAFVFCMLINKNVLEWFLLIMCKERTLSRTINFASSNHPLLCFCLRRKGWQMPNTL